MIHIKNYPVPDTFGILCLPICLNVLTGLAFIIYWFPVPPEFIFENVDSVKILVSIIFALSIWITFMAAKYLKALRQLSDYSFVLDKLSFNPSFEKLLKATNESARQEMRDAVDREANYRKTGQEATDQKNHACKKEEDYWRFLQLLDDYGLRGLPDGPDVDL